MKNTKREVLKKLFEDFVQEARTSDTLRTKLPGAEFKGVVDEDKTGRVFLTMSITVGKEFHSDIQIALNEGNLDDSIFHQELGILISQTERKLILWALRRLLDE